MQPAQAQTQRLAHGAMRTTSTLSAERAKCDDDAHLLVVQAVVDILPLLFIHDDARRPQLAKLLRNVGLRLAEQRLKMADALGVAPHGIQHAQPLRVRQ